ncbi:MAG: helix-turn-helix transcriptional regulator [Clostridiales bacterium]|nr:helix-turn-helix transcriptional regulator [Clostridiales bacterium]
MLGENIRNLRMARGLSQEELAQKLHIVRQTVSKWEKGVSHS